MSTVAVNRRNIGTQDTGVRTRRKSRTRAKVGHVVLARGLTFFGVAFAAYFASSMGGHIMIDQARREGSVAQVRAVSANKAILALERSVRDLKSSVRVERWATTNGMSSTELIPGISAPGEQGTIVAKNN
ncbi:MAG: hypothetical protein ABL949_09390 [Fimbriimonadaceae bacterium]